MSNSFCIFIPNALMEFLRRHVSSVLSLTLSTALTILALGLFHIRPATAQTLNVESGATLQVQNGAVLDLEGGEMDLGGVNATARLNEVSAGRVAGGILIATRDLSNPASANPAGLGAILTASTDLGDVTITRGHAVQTASNGNTSIRRYYDVSSTQGGSGLDATLAFTYHDAELNGLAEPDLELFRSTDSGASWTPEGADSRSTASTGDNTVTLSGITTFSRWTLGGASSPLPVELADFSGVRDGDGVRLTWRTLSESGNAGFRVQRQSDGMGPWREVGFVESRASGGTTTEAQAYRFEDATFPFAADSVAYRLQQIDVDGSKSVSDPIVIDRSAVNEARLLGTYPNPARTRATVEFAIPEQAEEARLDLYDVLGRRVASVASGVEAGRHKRTLTVSDLASGVYFLRLKSGGDVKTTKLTVVR